jgi:hypothetical protein
VFRVPALVLLALLACLAATGGQPEKAAPKIEELVADLGNPVYSVREKAQRELWHRGDAAKGALEKALQDGNPEVVRRARELLEKLSWGVRPESPAEVLRLLRQFQAGDPDPSKSLATRREAIVGLLKHGTPGVSITRALLGKDLPAEVKHDLIVHVTAHLRREIPRRLFDGKLEEAAELIALHAAGTGPEGAADYAVFQLLRGELPGAIALAEATLKAGKQTANQRLLLAHLYRARGDWAKARAMAADLPAEEDAPGPIEFLREDEGDWARLAETLNYGGMNHPEAMRLSILRLAGRTEEFDEAARKLAREAADLTDTDEVFNAAVALFANHRPLEATKILMDHRRQQGVLAEALVSQLRYKEALALVASPDLMRPHEILAFDIRRARVLTLTGQREAAVQLFSAVARQLSKDVPDLRSASFRFITSVRSLLRHEMRLGLKDLAAEHAAMFVTSDVFQYHERTVSGETAFEILFGPDGPAGESLFHALHRKKIPGSQAGPTMMHVRDLLSGKASRTAVDEALAALPDVDEADAIRGQYRQHQSLVPAWSLDSTIRLARAAVCRAAGREKDAEKAYAQAAELIADRPTAGTRTWVFGVSDTHRPFVEWGEFLFDRARYHEAAEQFLEGWKRFPEQPLLLFLSGQALIKAGDAKEGARRMDLSHWVSLGQERIRGKFLDELVRRGEAAAAKREVELVLRGCWCRDHYFGNVMNQAAQAAVLNRDFAAAENCRQRSLLVTLRTPDVFFVELSAYMNVPHDLLVYRARARLTAGKTDEAMAIARDVLAVTPGHIELVSGMVPELERLGKKREAAELFDRAWTAHSNVLAEFPASGSARHALATLAANCRREVDAGLTFAREAVKAEPESVVYRDTLAELHFIKGDRDSAMDVMAKLVAEQPRNLLYRRQLVRYRSGDLASPRPVRAD